MIENFITNGFIEIKNEKILIQENFDGTQIRIKDNNKITKRINLIKKNGLLYFNYNNKQYSIYDIVKI